MAREIERKFLVKDDSWKSGQRGLVCRQGYLSSDADMTIRVRVIGEQGFLTIKGKTEGIARDEFEYEIPRPDAEVMLGDMCRGRIVEKVRYHIEYGGTIWDVDEFTGANSGLVLAEVELADELQEVALPDWIGQEVTGEVRYYNAYLAEHPFGEGNR